MLDTKSWENSEVMALMAGLGNTAVNSAYEEELSAQLQRYVGSHQVKAENALSVH